jgi:hypothetical protein
VSRACAVPKNGLVHVVDEIPTENPVDGVAHLREALLQERGEIFDLSGTDVAVDVRKDILDEDLAAELFAEEAHVAADNRAEIEQHR